MKKILFCTWSRLLLIYLNRAVAKSMYTVLIVMHYIYDVVNWLEWVLLPTFGTGFKSNYRLSTDSWYIGNTNSSTHWHRVATLHSTLMLILSALNNSDVLFGRKIISWFFLVFEAAWMYLLSIVAYCMYDRPTMRQCREAGDCLTLTKIFFIIF